MNPKTQHNSQKINPGEFRDDFLKQDIEEISGTTSKAFWGILGIIWEEIPRGILEGISGRTSGKAPERIKLGFPRKNRKKSFEKKMAANVSLGYR